MKALRFLLLLFLNASAGAQSIDTTQWNTNANRGTETRWLSPLDREIVREINKARTDPALYAVLYIEPMIKMFKGNINTSTNVETQEGIAALKECVREMKKAKKVGMLEPLETLYETASYHTSRQSKTKEVGHTSPNGKTFADRMRALKLPASSECISYGERNARGVITALLIDDGVLDRGHRKNILDPRFNRVGVASGLHKLFGTMSTIDLAMVR